MSESTVENVRRGQTPADILDEPPADDVAETDVLVAAPEHSAADRPRCRRHLHVVLHEAHARHPPRARHLELRLGAVRPGDVAPVEVPGPVQHPDGPQPVRRPHVVRPVLPRSVLLAVPGRGDHVLRPVAGDRRRRDPGVPLRASAARVGVVRDRRSRDLPAPPGGELDRTSRTSTPTRSSACSSASRSTPRSNRSGGCTSSSWCCRSS